MYIYIFYKHAGLYYFSIINFRKTFSTVFNNYSIKKLLCEMRFLPGINSLYKRHFDSTLLDKKELLEKGGTGEDKLERLRVE
jgi:hypothetical protein